MNKAAFETWCDKVLFNRGVHHTTKAWQELIWQYFNQDAPNPGTNEPKVGTGEFPREAIGRDLRGLFHEARRLENAGPELREPLIEKTVSEIELTMEKRCNHTTEWCYLCGWTPQTKKSIPIKSVCPTSGDLPVSAGKCLTCGGSGEVRAKGCKCEYCEINGPKEPCPDCGQHTFLRKDGLKHPDQRKGEQRERGSRRESFDVRRVKDRRGILTGSLKATRPQDE